MSYLVLTRRKDESIIIDDNIIITVVNVGKSQVRIGIEAPEEITVHREEISNKIAEQKKAAEA